VTHPYDLTPDQVAALRRGADALARFERLERGLPPEAPCACPDPPRRRRVVLANPTAEERRLIATGPPPPPTTPVAARRVTLADAKRAEPPWLPRVSRLVASGYPSGPARFSGHVRDASVACAHCGVRHRLDFQCDGMRNRTPAGSYSAVVASGGHLP